jgi:hypothetical protein
LRFKTVIIINSINMGMQSNVGNAKEAPSEAEALEGQVEKQVQEIVESVGEAPSSALVRELAGRVMAFVGSDLMSFSLLVGGGLGVVLETIGEHDSSHNVMESAKITAAVGFVAGGVATVLSMMRDRRQTS